MNHIKSIHDQINDIVREHGLFKAEVKINTYGKRMNIHVQVYAAGTMNIRAEVFHTGFMRDEVSFMESMEKKLNEKVGALPECYVQKLLNESKTSKV